MTSCTFNTFVCLYLFICVNSCFFWSILKISVVTCLKVCFSQTSTIHLQESELHNNMITNRKLQKEEIHLHPIRLYHSHSKPSLDKSAFMNVTRIFIFHIRVDFNWIMNSNWEIAFISNFSEEVCKIYQSRPQTKLVVQSPK